VNRIDMSAAPFDRLAQRYDALWTKSLVGRCQRQAVWGWLDSSIEPGTEILDLGCGTGEDALHFEKLGARVVAIDASAQMVRFARTRGVNALQLQLESLDSLSGNFDGATSNFGALNCLRNLEPVARSLARLIRPGGFLAICVIGRCCAWEVSHFIRRGQFRTAFRRFRRDGAPSSLGIRITYPSIRDLAEAFRPAFQLMRWTGIGLCIPPSYISGLSRKQVTRLARIDRRLADWPVLRALADHRLLLFERR
jgi:ubiquinone/menaquinone biosynthesis C-methylase UbiE